MALQFVLGHMTSTESPLLWTALLLGFALGFGTALGVLRSLPQKKEALSRSRQE